MLECAATLAQLIFEIRDLRYATPATATRAGILYISEGQQWRSMVESWLRREAKCAAWGVVGEVKQLAEQACKHFVARRPAGCHCTGVNLERLRLLPGLTQSVR